MYSSSKSRNRYFYALIATVSPLDQQLMARKLRLYRSTIKLVLIDTLELTREHLQTSWLERYNFPHLLILDLELANRSAVWAFLGQVRAAYPLLTVTVTSFDQQTETIAQAYDLGINVYVVKSQEADQWEKQVNTLAQYWLTVASLPKLSL